ncbi:MAG: UpxY family transcription antiterminator [Gemmatimonadales bacterium]|nr:MAG: UpxY family transcription antiterminator [Gemmatimonadales bacterium]
MTFGQSTGTGYPRRLLERPHWFALRTRARHEKKVVRQLEGAGIQAFGALARVERDWTDRTRAVEMPLFPGYVFVHTTLRDPGAVLRWPGAVEFVRSRGVPRPVRPDEMEAVMTLARGVTAQGKLPSQEDYLAVGTPVVVVEGPFAGLTGVLTEHRGRRRMVVKLDSLRQARGVSVPTEYVKQARSLSRTG